MTIHDKSFVFTRWYRSVWVMILVIAIAIFPNDYPIKWVLVCLLLPFFGLSREIFLNVNANSIDRRFNFFGIKRMIERFPIEQTKSISVKQNPKKSIRIYPRNGKWIGAHSLCRRPQDRYGEACCFGGEVSCEGGLKLIAVQRRKHSLAEIVKSD